MTALPNPSAGIDAVTLRDGRHLLVYNHSGTEKVRVPLNIAISRDGKKWEATEMTPDPSQRSLVPVNGKSGSSSITFVISGKPDNLGQPRNLSDSNTITYWGGDAFFVGAKSGQVTVQKMDDKFIEGTFNFAAEKEGRKVTCTDGEFRITAPAPAAN